MNRTSRFAIALAVMVAGLVVWALRAVF